jgi:N-acetylmuramoyl-L-alanine amidase
MKRLIPAGNLLAGLLLWGGAFLSSYAQDTRIDGVDYVPVSSLAESAGLKTSMLEPQKRMLLADTSSKLELQVNSREARLDGLRVFLGDPVVPYRGTFYISRTDRDRMLLPIMEPRRTVGSTGQPKIIVIDAGHGGKDHGTENTKLHLREKDMALDVAKRLEKLLKAAGYRVVLTRNKDVFLPLPLRPLRANKEKADLFVSIHFNAINSPDVSGIETYILTPQNQRSTGSDRSTPDDAERCTGNAHDRGNAVFGFRMHSAMIRGLQGFDRGYKHARFAVLRDIDCPGLLVECGYLSNTAEARRIGTKEWRQKIAVSIAEGVAGYRAAIDNRPAAPKQTSVDSRPAAAAPVPPAPRAQELKASQ